MKFKKEDLFYLHDWQSDRKGVAERAWDSMGSPMVGGSTGPSPAAAPAALAGGWLGSDAAET